MPNLTVSVPSGGTSRTVIAVEPGQELRFSFPFADTSVTREDTDLVITFDSGGELVLEGFFVADDTGALPVMELVDGSRVDAADFLRALNPDMDLATAAGPSAGPASGGAGEYSDDGGALLGGIDRLGSLGSMQFANASATAEEVETALAETGGPDVPEPLGYSARAVLYRTDDDSSYNIHFRLLGADGQPLADPSGMRYVIESAHGLIDIGSVTFANGLGTITVSEAGKAALAGASENLYDYLTITIDGITYTMQVVLNQSGDFNANEVHDAWLPDGAITHEWHTETNGTGEGSRTTGNSVDEVFFSNDNGAAFTNSTLNTGTGADTVYISGATHGVSTHGDGATIITAAEGTVNVQGNGSAVGDVFGILTKDTGTTEITASEVSLNATNNGTGHAFAVLANGSGASNTISGSESVIINAINNGDTANATGVFGCLGGKNFIGNVNGEVGSLTVTASVKEAGTDRAVALYTYSNAAAQSSLNDIHVGSISLTAHNLATSSAIDYFGAGGMFALAEGGGKSINSITASDAVTIDVYSAGREAIGMHAASTNTINEITAGGTVTMKVISDEDIAHGMYAWHGANTVTSHDGQPLDLAIAVHGKTGSYAMKADDSNGKNLIQGNSVAEGPGDTISLTGDLGVKLGGSNEISTGDGDDAITITGDLIATIQDQGGSNKIFTHAGDDKVTITGDLEGWATTDAAAKSIIDLGAGDDWLCLNATSVKNFTFDGGAGGESEGDVLQLGLASVSVLGDILGTGNGNTFSGFENLILDLKNGTADATSLDELLAHATNTAFTGVDNIYIHRDANDAIDTTGWTANSTDEVRLNGDEYTAYTCDTDPDAILYLLITTTG